MPLLSSGTARGGQHGVIGAVCVRARVYSSDEDFWRSERTSRLLGTLGESGCRSWSEPIGPPTGHPASHTQCTRRKRAEYTALMTSPATAATYDTAVTDLLGLVAYG